MGLERYHEKRDFRRTPEPADDLHGGEGSSFVIQKHAARRLHYDFRLELDGVLLSWAVPKGPSLDPRERRLAVQTEDHPLEYADFEGVIPLGEYGGGTVVVWDRGTWRPLGDAHEMMRRGRLTFELSGEKLHGTWHLVKTSGDDDRRWLLIKSKDESAKRDGEIVDEEPAGVKSGGTPARLTHPNKVLWPEQGVTKLELARYYDEVAELMLPHLRDRPLTLLRCPAGRHKQCFFQKVAHPPLPDGVHPVEFPEGGVYTCVDSREGLLGLVQLGVLEIHTWGSRRDKLEHPDQLVLDLDPDVEVEWRDVVHAAVELRDRLAALGLASFVKTTGGKGLHVVVPLVRRARWDEAKAFAKAVVERMKKDDPTRYVITPSKAKRRGRIFLDYLRNGRGATAVCVFSTRHSAGAPISAPVEWEELGETLRSNAFTVRNFPNRLRELGADPWAGFFAVRQSITKQMQHALGMR